MAAQPSAELDVRQPFTYAAGIAAGLRPSQLRGKRFRKLFRGVYISSAEPFHEMQRIVAALLIHPAGAFASHVSAARVYDAPLPAGLAEVHISVFEQVDRRHREGLRSHVVPRGVPVGRCRDLPVSLPEQTFVELAVQLSLVDLVAVGDYFVKKGWATPEQLLAHARGPYGNAAAVRAAGYVRRDVDSPMETRLRMLIVLAGLPEPVVDFRVYWADGRLRYRFDLSYPHLKILVEYDGRQHRADLQQWDHDTKRADWLREAGWLYLPVFSWGIYRRPDETLARIEKALRERGCRELPRRLRDDWRPYFPVLA